MVSSTVKICATLLAIASIVSAAVIGGSEITTDLAVREDKRASTSTEVVALVNPIAVALVFVAVRQAAWSAFTWLAGVFGLGASIYGVAKDCVKEFSRTDCILGSVGLVTSTFISVYKFTSGLSIRVRSDNLLTYGIWTDPDEPLLTAEVHVPLDSTGRIMRPDLVKRDASNGTEWERYVTYYWDNEEYYYLMYRQAHAADLGHENDGTFHHLRAQDSKSAKAQLNSTGRIDRRIEDQKYGVVTDYLYKNTDKNMWGDMSKSIDKNDLAQQVTNYLQNNKQEVSCFTMTGQVCTHGGCTTKSRIDNGVIAYGWNGHAFDFSGRAGGWVDQCKGSNVN